MVLHACRDHAMSGGHLAYKHTFDKVRDRFWWPTLHHDVKKNNVRIVMPASDEKLDIAGPSYPEVTYPLIAHSNVFQ